MASIINHFWSWIERFLTCIQLQALRCPPGLAFSLKKQTCDWESAVTDCHLKSKLSWGSLNILAFALLFNKCHSERANDIYFAPADYLCDIFCGEFKPRRGPQNLLDIGNTWTQCSDWLHHDDTMCPVFCPWSEFQFCIFFLATSLERCLKFQNSRNGHFSTTIWLAAGK